MDTVVIRVFGIVQGVGFRPFVSRLAAGCGLFGTVCNKGSYVEIAVQGTEAAVAAFCRRLPMEAPQRSAILKLDTERQNRPPYSSFTIVESVKEGGDIFVSPDIAICDACKHELFDRHNRRYLHPFINCTACGPRLTILDAMPYDRERTSMGAFPMCKQCHAEYTDPASRRYDAQPVCCNDCGPEVYLLGRPERRHAAIAAARKCICQGGVIAVKGIGGFHLCCDAGNEAAVQRLRNQKHRPVKPLAVMMKDMAAVRRECVIGEEEEAVLDGHQKPIVLLRKRKGGRLCPAVAPENPRVGVMLPYAPLQLLLFTYDDGLDMPDCLVMTSANESGAPICRTDEDAAAIAAMCDLILSHNRRSRLRADDSVMTFYKRQPYMIRRSRGYAPLPYFFGDPSGRQVLALGGELKNAFCIGKSNLFYLSPYIGDMADIRTVDALRESVRRMETLLEASPSVVACDLHPLYNTTALAQEWDRPVVGVQHHYAHILSCMAENNRRDPVIGIAFDGTGYGTDGTIWGGEVLIASLQTFQRYASIAPFAQCGGDAAAREGWRIALSLLGRDMVAQAQQLSLCSEEQVRAQQFMMARQVNCVTSTSAGRLFDGMSAILGLRRQSTFEGEGAMALQFAAEAWEERHGAGRIPEETLRQEDGRWIMATDDLVRRVTALYQQGMAPSEAAYAFHLGLAGLIAAAAENARRDTAVAAVALSGGVFQNTLLLRLCGDALQERGFTVLTHRLVPPNDGGLALGQAVYASENNT